MLLYIKVAEDVLLVAESGRPAPSAQREGDALPIGRFAREGQVPDRDMDRGGDLNVSELIFGTVRRGPILVQRPLTAC